MLAERANRVLLSLAAISPKAGMDIMLPGRMKESLCSVGWCHDEYELRYILHSYLEVELGFLRASFEFVQWSVLIHPKGWAHIESLQAANPQSQRGFIAMWFDPQVNDAWKAIEKGIEWAGYQPLRIDQRQHNNKIDDEIVAAIRSSRFVVSDFTGHRGGVYFEAGFAMGLGIPVIWLCRKDELDKAHFDTRQYNFIVWDPVDLPALTKALKNRIEATIGRGPAPENNKAPAT